MISDGKIPDLAKVDTDIGSGNDRSGGNIACDSISSGGAGSSSTGSCGATGNCFGNNGNAGSNGDTGDTGNTGNAGSGQEIFYRLSPFIRDYIYRNNWSELRSVQVEACKVIFNTDLHLLLSSGTASGKTEAAFLPILTKLYEEPSSTIGVLYIAPIKALINDQFLRLNDLLTEADIPVWHWHGDVSVTHKQKLMRNPSGILQITPESLESMLINKNRDLMRMFGDLRFIIIDEVHAFMGTDRGIQVICQLERLSRYIREAPRRIGLSATLGDYSLAEAWLSSGTNKNVATPKVKAGGQKVRLSVEHFYEPSPAETKKDEMPAEVLPSASLVPTIASTSSAAAVSVTEAASSVSAMIASIAAAAPSQAPDNEKLKASAFWEYVYEKTLGRRCIIFTNLREHAETSIATLRQIAELRGTPDIYHVHHGSISASLRESAETDMKESPLPIVTAATVSLEMGIDVGKLERIVQIDSPNSVSSFLQRLGRSGRRGNPAEILFVCQEEKPSGLPLLPYQIPWKLLQAISIIELYVKERWIESPCVIKYPLNMLYHQTMSVLAGTGELQPAALAQRILGMSSFRNITLYDYSELVQSLIKTDHLQITEENGLIIGLKGERIINNHRFYAVFPDEDEFTVVAESKQIGKIEVPPPPGERITLAGRTWEVKDVDMQQKMVFTIPVKGKIRTFWQGSGMKLDNHIISTIRNILLSDEMYPYIGDGAGQRLGEARFAARNSLIAKANVISLGGKTICILPWVGTDDYHALLFIIRKICGKAFDFKSIGGLPPYFIMIRLGNGTARELFDTIKNIFDTGIDLFSLLHDDDVLELKRNIEYRTPKFDSFIPVSLHRKALINDHINLERLSAAVSKWVYASEEREAEKINK